MARVRKVNNTANESVFSRVSDIPFVEKPPETNLAEGLFEAMDQQKVITAFEEAKGIVPKKTVTPKVLMKSIMLDMDKSADRKLFEQMLNEERFKIVSMDKTWTAIGRYRAFVIYSETQVSDNT